MHSQVRAANLSGVPTLAGNGERCRHILRSWRQRARGTGASAFIKRRAPRTVPVRCAAQCASCVCHRCSPFAAKRPPSACTAHLTAGVRVYSDRRACSFISCRPLVGTTWQLIAFCYNNKLSCNLIVIQPRPWSGQYGSSLPFVITTSSPAILSPHDPTLVGTVWQLIAFCYNNKFSCCL